MDYSHVSPWSTPHKSSLHPCWELKSHGLCPSVAARQKMVLPTSLSPHIRDSCTFFSLLISLSVPQQPQFTAVKNQACLQVLTLRTSLHLEWCCRCLMVGAPTPTIPKQACEANQEMQCLSHWGIYNSILRCKVFSWHISVILLIFCVPIENFSQKYWLLVCNKWKSQP